MVDFLFEIIEFEFTYRHLDQQTNNCNLQTAQIEATEDGTNALLLLCTRNQ